jgi:ribosomal-protein-alanine N-acetyltransferase
MARIVLPGEPIVSGDTALRPWRDSDAAALVELCSDPEIARWTRVPHPYRETDARLYLLHRHDAVLAGTTAPFAIVSASDGAVLGSVALMTIEWQPRRAEVGYWLGAPARGRGHATRAVQAICAWGHESLGLGRFTLLAATGNTASQLVAERAGFTREAVLRSYCERGGSWSDMIAFGLLAP